MRFRYMFYLDVACVPSECCICCNDYTHMLQKRDVSNVSAVSDVCCKCFIRMLDMLQWPYTYVASVCFKCFNYFKRMLQVFYLDVANVALTHMLQVYILNVCCKCFYLDVAYVQCFTHMLQAYVCKCLICFGHILQQMLMLQVLHDQTREVGVDVVVPSSVREEKLAQWPHMHAQSYVYRSSRWDRAYRRKQVR
jgi:hypothetical protein